MPGPIVWADNYRGETYDARRSRLGWNMVAGYTSTIDPALTWVPVGIADPPADRTDTFRGASAPLSAPRMVGQLEPPVREIQRFATAERYAEMTPEQQAGATPTLREVTPEAHPHRRTWDTGQNKAGFLEITVRGEPGQRINIRHAEWLNTESAFSEGGITVGGGDGPIGTLYRAALRHNWVGGRGEIANYTYTLRGDPEGETWTSRFHFQGYQFFEISGIEVDANGDPLPGQVELISVESIAVSSDNGLTSSFETSNPLVNQLYSNIVWSILGNHVSVPTDCPNRDERLAWTGDAQIIARTAAYTQNLSAMYSRWMRDIRAYQGTQTGFYEGLVPVVAH